MPILVLFGLLLFGTASAACAQQRDTTTRRDTVTRRAPALPRDTLAGDTLRRDMTRADSLLLERELGRVRGEPRRTMPPGAVGPRDTLQLPSQDTLPIAAVHWWFEAGPVLAHGVYRDPALRTRSRIGAAFRGAVEYRFGWGVGTFGMFGGSLARVEADHVDGEERSGTASQIDLQAGLTWRPPIRQREPEMLTVQVAGGGAWLSGPGRVRPFDRVADQDPPVGAWEVALAVRPATGRFGATAALQSVRVLPPAPDTDNWAQRVILAVRFGS